MDSLPNPKDLEPQSARAMRFVWLKMTNIYGHWWVKDHGEAAEHFDEGPLKGQLTADAKTWAEGLGGLTAAQIRDGVTACQFSSDRFAPVLPEFRARCLGIPSLAKVELVLTKRVQQSDSVAAFCRLVWRLLSSYELARADSYKASRMVSGAYELAREYRMQLGELPPAPAAVIGEEIPVKPTAASTEEAQAHMDQIEEMLSRRWASDAPASPTPETTDDFDGEQQ